MAKKTYTNTGALDVFGKKDTTTSQVHKEPDTVEVTPAAGVIDKNNSKTKKDRKYLRLDTTDYQDYIRLMADHKGVSQTNYIQQLIQKDMDSNTELFDKLKKIEALKNEL